jgi:hypothetical protein
MRRRKPATEPDRRSAARLGGETTPGFHGTQAEVASETFQRVVDRNAFAQVLDPAGEPDARCGKGHVERPEQWAFAKPKFFQQRQRTAQGLGVRERRAVRGYFPATGSRSTWIVLGA